MKSISIVIPVYNEEKVICRCLKSLSQQTLQAKEIIVVDDGSADKTLQVLSNFQFFPQSRIPLRPVPDGTGLRGTIFNFQLLQQKHCGAGAARNLGAGKATGDILVFVDADMRFHPKFLEELTETIHEGKSKGTFSKLEYIANWNNRWARFWNYDKGIYEPRAIPVDYPKTAPVFRAILKSEFDRAGGFDENKGYNDDWSLSEKLGIKATEAKAKFFHYNPQNLAEVFIQARWAGKRKYKLGILGALAREFPLWASMIGIIRVIRRKREIGESLLSLLTLYPLFLLTIKTASTIGIIEFMFWGKSSK
ncbi:glycosyltransferase family 2 protein [Candidatus Collierbacteria bacterium]|nr:glycosyltransferase family 2 protein [Candidatus Collierbacteria bacterium]